MGGQRTVPHAPSHNKIIAVQIACWITIQNLYRIYRKCQLIYLFFLYILAFRFLSFFEKYFLSVATIISCCFISCWWLGKANLGNVFHFSLLFNSSWQRIIHEGSSGGSLSFFPLHEGFVLFLLLTVFAFHSLSLVSLKSMFLACQLFYTNYSFILHPYSFQVLRFQSILT